MCPVLSSAAKCDDARDGRCKDRGRVFGGQSVGLLKKKWPIMPLGRGADERGGDNDGADDGDDDGGQGRE